ARTLADYKELALDLLDSWKHRFVVGTGAPPVWAERSSAAAACGHNDSGLVIADQTFSRISFVASNPSLSYKCRPSSLACKLTERKPRSLTQAKIVSMICRAIPRFRNSGSVYTFRITARSVHGSLGFAGHGHS